MNPQNHNSPRTLISGGATIPKGVCFGPGAYTQYVHRNNGSTLASSVERPTWKPVPSVFMPATRLSISAEARRRLGSHVTTSGRNLRSQLAGGRQDPDEAAAIDLLNFSRTSRIETITATPGTSSTPEISKTQETPRSQDRSRASTISTSPELSRTPELAANPATTIPAAIARASEILMLIATPTSTIPTTSIAPITISKYTSYTQSEDVERAIERDEGIRVGQRESPFLSPQIPNASVSNSFTPVIKHTGRDSDGTERLDEEKPIIPTSWRSPNTKIVEKTTSSTGTVSASCVARVGTSSSRVPSSYSDENKAASISHNKLPLPESDETKAAKRLWEEVLAINQSEEELSLFQPKLPLAEPQDNSAYIETSISSLEPVSTPVPIDAFPKQVTKNDHLSTPPYLCIPLEQEQTMRREFCNGVSEVDCSVFEELPNTNNLSIAISYQLQSSKGIKGASELTRRLDSNGKIAKTSSEKSFREMWKRKAHKLAKIFKRRKFKMSTGCPCNFT